MAYSSIANSSNSDTNNTRSTRDEDNSLNINFMQSCYGLWETGNKLLSQAKDLWSQHGKASGLDIDSHFSNFGIKHEEADGSFLQKKQLEFVHHKYDQQIDSERIEKLGSLCIGEYDQDSNKVRLQKLKGRTWSCFGHADGGCLSLFPEEALFLIDISILRVIFNSVPLSLQEAYSLFFKQDEEITIKHYMAYSYLCRLGYFVRRKPCEQESSMEVENISVQEAATEKSKRKTSVADFSIDTKTPKVSTERTDYCSSVSPQCTNVHIDGSSIPSSIPYTKFDYSLVTLPTEHIEQQALNDSKASCFSFHSLMDYRSTKESCAAENWHQFKMEHRKRLHSIVGYTNNPKDSPALVSSSDMNSLAQILNKLKLSKTISLKDINHHQESGETLIFDVFKPCANFKRSNPGRPQFRVKVVSSQQNIPSLSGLANLMQTGDCVPFYWAVCDGGDVTFYSQQQESIVPDLYLSQKRKTKKKSKT